MSVSKAISTILDRYIRERETTPFPGGMRQQFDQLEERVAALPAIRDRQEMRIQSGFGMGQWSRSPWIAILDPTTAPSPQQGLQLKLRFPQDMSGVFVTLDQGHSRDITERGRQAARRLWQERAAAIRHDHGDSLSNAGLRIDRRIDMGLDDTRTAADVQASVVAWRFYEGKELEADQSTLERDLAALIDLYHQITERHGDRPQTVLDPEALETMRARFLQHMTGFESFAVPGEYAPQERDYKVAISRAFRTDLLPMLAQPVVDDGDAGERIEALHTFLTRRKFGDWQQPQNLVGWRMTAHLAALTAAEKRRAAELYRDLLAWSGPSPVRVERFNAEYLSILAAHMETGLQSVSRSLPTLLLMLANPDHDILVRTMLFEDAGRRLTSHRLLSGDPLDSGDYGACLDLASAVREALEGWGWGPQDMIDVQGFLWVAATDAYDEDTGVSDKEPFRQAAESDSERRIFKISPGEQAKYWEECRNAGFICVGWDEIGDLRDFGADASEEEFVAAFRDAYPDTYQGTPGKLAVGMRKAKELWQFGGLEPGDIILANRGVSRLLAAGVVEEPGYEFDDDRAEFKHVARVRWNDSFARDIKGALTPGERAIWMNSTLAPVERSLYRKLLGFAPSSASLEADQEAEDKPSREDYAEPRLSEIAIYIRKLGLLLSDRLIRRYHAAIRSRGFVILAGVSGTGKTWLAEAYAKAIGAHHLVVRVAPNWNSNEDLLGWVSPLDGAYRDTSFSSFLRGAADAWRNGSRRPFHVLLDEMNLARVEHYFADFLSALEQRNRYGAATLLLGGEEVGLYPNLVFIGTVNMDETTHGFAQKVYDRAQLIEVDLDAEAFASRVVDHPWSEDLVDLRELLEEAAPIAFRTADDIIAYVAECQAHGASWQEAFDEAVLQKVLPRIGGMDLAVGEALDRLVLQLGDRYPLSAAKARQMRERFAHGVASFF